MKRGSITLYLIIGLLIVMILGFLMLGNNNISYNRSDSAEFSSMRNNLKIYVQSCLEQTALRAIDEHGLSDSSRQIEDYVDAHLFDCVDFSIFRGYTVDYRQPSTSVIMSDSSLFLTTQFPVTMKRSGDSLSLTEFSLKIKTSSVIETPGGLLRGGSILLTEDEDFIMKAEKDTKITDQKGNPVEQVIISTVDKEFDGLNNGVVVGEVAYNGQPSGARFSPPLTVTIKIHKRDIPIGYRAQELKVGFYDEDSGLWFTYTELPMDQQGDYYYFSASVEHFTPIAVVACGTQDNGVFHMRMNYAYASPIQPIAKEDGGFEELVWEANTLEGTIEGKHLNFDEMKKAHCEFLKPEEVKSAISLSDRHGYGSETHSDIEAPTASRKVYAMQADPEFPVQMGDALQAGDDIKECLFLLADWDDDDQSAVAVSGKDTCYADCVAKAKEMHKDIYNSLDADSEIRKIAKNADEYVEYFVYGKTNGQESMHSWQKTGDGILDTLTTDGDLSCAEAVCTVSAGALSTPLTYGYRDTSYTDWLESLPSAIPFMTDEGVGGYGEFMFDLYERGDACVDPNSLSASGAAATLLNPIHEKVDAESCTEITVGQKLFCGGAEIGPLGNTVIQDSGDGYSCSAGDKCIWSLNNPTVGNYGDGEKVSGELRAGVNIIGVWVANINNDADAGASAILEIRGTGITGQEDCGTTVQDRIEYIYGCGRNQPNPDYKGQVNCLAQVREGTAGNMRKTSICQMDYDGVGTVGTPCEQVMSELLPGDTVGGFCGTCPTEATPNADGRVDGYLCKICPGRMTERDDGCWCVNDITGSGEEYTADKGESYCCNGEILTKKDNPNFDGCWQTSPVALKKAGNVQCTFNTDLTSSSENCLCGDVELKDYYNDHQGQKPAKFYCDGSIFVDGAAPDLTCAYTSGENRLTATCSPNCQPPNVIISTGIIDPCTDGTNNICCAAAENTLGGCEYHLESTADAILEGVCQESCVAPYVKVTEQEGYALDADCDNGICCMPMVAPPVQQSCTCVASGTCQQVSFEGAQFNVECTNSAQSLCCLPQAATICVYSDNTDATMNLFFTAATLKNALENSPSLVVGKKIKYGVASEAECKKPQSDSQPLEANMCGSSVGRVCGEDSPICCDANGDAQGGFSCLVDTTTASIECSEDGLGGGTQWHARVDIAGEPECKKVDVSTVSDLSSYDLSSLVASGKDCRCGSSTLFTHPAEQESENKYCCNPTGSYKFYSNEYECKPPTNLGLNKECANGVGACKIKSSITTTDYDYCSPDLILYNNNDCDANAQLGCCIKIPTEKVCIVPDKNKPYCGGEYITRRAYNSETYRDYSLLPGITSEGDCPTLKCDEWDRQKNQLGCCVQSREACTFEPLTREQCQEEVGILKEPAWISYIGPYNFISKDPFCFYASDASNLNCKDQYCCKATGTGVMDSDTHYYNVINGKKVEKPDECYILEGLKDSDRKTLYKDIVPLSGKSCPLDCEQTPIIPDVTLVCEYRDAYFGGMSYNLIPESCTICTTVDGNWGKVTCNDDGTTTEVLCKEDCYETYDCNAKCFDEIDYCVGKGSPFVGGVAAVPKGCSACDRGSGFGAGDDIYTCLGNGKWSELDDCGGTGNGNCVRDSEGAAFCQEYCEEDGPPI
jgi:hypothetical protein